MLTRIFTKLIPFVAAFVASLFLVGVINSYWVGTAPLSSQSHGAGSGGHGTGQGSGFGTSGGPASFERKETTPLRITAKPKASYTDDARTNEVEGTVRL